MSKFARFSGEITINPPLTRADVTGTRHDPWDFNYDDTTLVSLYADLHTEAVEGIAPIDEDRVSVDLFIKQTQRIIDRFGPGRTFAGHILAFGEEDGDIWRLEIIDGRATKVTPRIVWPDGSEGLK